MSYKKENTRLSLALHTVFHVPVLELHNQLTLQYIAQVHSSHAAIYEQFPPVQPINFARYYEWEDLCNVVAQPNLWLKLVLVLSNLITLGSYGFYPDSSPVLYSLCGRYMANWKLLQGYLLNK